MPPNFLYNFDNSLSPQRLLDWDQQLHMVFLQTRLHCRSLQVLASPGELQPPAMAASYKRYFPLPSSEYVPAGTSRQLSYPSSTSLSSSIVISQVNFTLVPKSAPIPPPWGSLSSLSSSSASSQPETAKPARLYPNVRGCGYPPTLHCDGEHFLPFTQSQSPHHSMPDFFSEFGSLGAKYECWVSHLDPDIAITELDLRRLKREVMHLIIVLAHTSSR